MEFSKRKLHFIPLLYGLIVFLANVAEQIPFEARIMALADVFDALVSKRCYKDSFSYDKAFEIIQNDLGTHFDPQLGAEFIKCRTSLEELYERNL